ncbi:caspase family protein [Chitinophaga flava]|uniref:Peptidase C14 caspase domain-containing protein n=1 Tax=Chitinophaga flava TaxID=2259036 RepID=A0A365Y587_9BACT|nr:caspase family protein [Chitinophaga flava]RBL93045.1 hypothetical protein DF182_10880 [Chitinophaga flava]
MVESESEVTKEPFIGKRSTNPTLSAEKSEGKTYIFAIGIDNYRDKPLPNCVKDCKDLIEVLTKEFNDVVKGEVLYNEEATRENILYALGDIIESPINNPTNNLIIYFSGHGDSTDSEKNDFFWVPYIEDPRKIKDESFWVEASDILRKLEKYRFGHILVICDCCFSGGMLNVSQYFRRKMKDGRDNGIPMSRFYLAATRDYELALAGERNTNSKFTGQLLDLLKDNTAESVSWENIAREVQSKFVGSSSQVEYGHLFKVDVPGEFKLAGKTDIVRKRQRIELLPKVLEILNYNEQVDEFSDLEMSGKSPSFFIISGTPDSGLNRVCKLLYDDIFKEKLIEKIRVPIQLLENPPEDMVDIIAGSSNQGKSDNERFLTMMKNVPHSDIVIEIRIPHDNTAVKRNSRIYESLIRSLVEIVEKMNALAQQQKVYMVIIDDHNTDYSFINQFVRTIDILHVKTVKPLTHVGYKRWYKGSKRMEENFHYLFEELLWTNIKTVFDQEPELLPGKIIKNICNLSGCPDIASKFLHHD